MSIEKEGPTCIGRVVPSLERERLQSPTALDLRTKDAMYSIRLALEAEGFLAGDLVEIRLLRREGERAARVTLDPHPWGRYGTARPAVGAAEEVVWKPPVTEVAGKRPAAEDREGFDEPVP